MKKLLMVFVGLTLAGCASNKVRNVDTKIEAKGNSSLGTVGLVDDVATIQKETRADAELRAVMWQNNELESELRQEHYTLKQCRGDMSDPRLGGNGDVEPMLDVDSLQQPTDAKEQFGLNENKDLIFMTREDFLVRVKNERNYQTTLRQTMKVVVDAKESCERKMGIARVKAGLPAKRIQGKISVTSDGKVGQVFQKQEHSVDDAFQLAGEQGQ